MPIIESVSPVLRKPAKKAIRFSLMIAGQAGLGKTTLLATLFDGHLEPAPTDTASITGVIEDRAKIFARTEEITTFPFELETAQGVRLDLEVIDTPGYGDDLSPEQLSEKISNYLESTFDEVFAEEQRIHRNPKFEEHRVHCLLYLVEPTCVGLKQFDIEIMKKLAPRVNIVPIIAKADGLTRDEKKKFKQLIMKDIVANGISIYDFANEADDGISTNDLPFSVIGASFPHKNGKRGRSYKWGFVDCDDLANSDLTILQKALLQIARDNLREFTEDILYENYRTEKLLKDKAIVEQQ